MIDVERALEDLRRIVSTFLRRGEVTAVDSSGDSLRVQVKAWGVEDRWLEVVQPYGLRVIPKVGAEALLSSIAGVLAHQVVLQVGDRRYGLEGGEGGEVALVDDLGQKVHLTRDGIVLETTKPVEIKSNDVRLGNGADATLVRWPDLQTFLQGLTLPVSGTANLTSGAVTGTAGPPTSVPSMGTTRVTGK